MAEGIGNIKIMEEHSSKIFQFNKFLTQRGYDNLDYIFVDEKIKHDCLDTIVKAMVRNSIDVGIDYSKPWEELYLREEAYQIDYLFIGKMTKGFGKIFKDEEIGINIYPELKFGMTEFDSNEILKLSLIIKPIC